MDLISAASRHRIFTEPTPNGIAGEWGHNPLPGPRSYCGKTGCIETFVSGPGLVNDHRLFTGTALTADAIVAGGANREAGGER
jgi:fructokinase